MTRDQIEPCFKDYTAERFRELEHTEICRAHELNRQHKNGAALHFTNAAGWRQRAEAVAIAHGDRAT